MSDVESNEKDIKPSVSGKVTSGRRSVFRIIFDEVVVKNAQEIKNNFVEEIIIPTTIDWLYEVCSSLVNDMFKSPGYSRGSTLPRSYRGGSGTYTGYSKSFKSSRDRMRESSADNRILSYKDISFDSRRDAEKILADLRGEIMEYGTVNVSDLCSYAGVDQTWADVKYGWTNLDKANCFRGRDGRYYLNLPEPRPIEED